LGVLNLRARKPGILRQTRRGSDEPHRAALRRAAIERALGAFQHLDTLHIEELGYRGTVVLIDARTLILGERDIVEVNTSGRRACGRPDPTQCERLLPGDPVAGIQARHGGRERRRVRNTDLIQRLLGHSRHGDRDVIDALLDVGRGDHYLL
jgi:hypothetical protein